VVRANAEWEILAVNNLNEEIFATPAILEGRILYPDARGAVLFREAIDCALAGPIHCDRSMSTRVPGRVHQARLNGAPVDPPHR
jgi:hypothetical protein